MGEFWRGEAGEGPSYPQNCQEGRDALLARCVSAPLLRIQREDTIPARLHYLRPCGATRQPLHARDGKARSVGEGFGQGSRPSPTSASKRGLPWSVSGNVSQRMKRGTAWRHSLTAFPS
jgi:hypothetical protein